MRRAPRVLLPEGYDQKAAGRIRANDSFGSFTVFSENNLFSALKRKHNDPSDAYHLRLFDFVVLGSQVTGLTAEHDLVRRRT